MSSKVRSQASGSVILFRCQKDVIDALKRGDIERVRSTQKWPSDEVVRFALEKGFLQQCLRSLPDPRKNWSVPMDAMLLALVMQRMHNEHSLLLAPYMVNSSALIVQLGYNAKVLREGFNDQNKHPREAAFHGETMKHVLAHLKAGRLIQ